ncbi:MAG: hypothetical protein J5781_04120, partial [Clostridia bacterium]|nr:hypothetical protein [Clostridia bacterium]
MASETNLETGALSQNDFADVSKFSNWNFGDKWAMYQEGNGFMRPYLAKTWAAVKYYDKTGEEVTSYAQAKALWGVDDVIVRLHNSASFASQYDTLFAVGSGVTQDGWATEFKGNKAYSFNTAYTGTETLSLYPHYAVDAPTSATGTGYTEQYDSASHNISVSIEHDLGADAIYSYQWYKQRTVNLITRYVPIAGATSSTFGVKTQADSGTYKVTYKIKCNGHDEYGVYESEVKNISVAITDGNDPASIPNGKTATAGQTLNSVSLPDDWAWADPTTEVNELGIYWYAATYDGNVYYVDVTVNRANGGAWTGAGSGTQDDPYIITNKAEMELFRDIANGQNGATKNRNACAKLTADIDLEGDYNHQWMPIGYGNSNSERYCGIFDGNGHTISGLYFYDMDSYNAGLFGYIDQNGSDVGTIKDLTVEGSITACYGAGIVGQIYSIDCIVKNCVNKATVTGKSGNLGDPTAAGITRENSGTIINCINEGALYGTRVGGIACFNYTDDSSKGIIDCVNNGTVTGIDANHHNYLGGIVAAGNDGYITGCVNNGIISTSYAPTSYVFFVGGISGQNMGTITYCVNNGDISVGMGNFNAYVGGIVGMQNSQSAVGTVSRVIADCVNNGDVTFRGASASFDRKYRVGGIVGNVTYDYSCTINNCYNAGQVVAYSTAYENGHQIAGGIIGYVDAEVQSTNLTVENCYNIGGLTGSDTGEIIGSGSATITNCRYLAAETNAETGALAQADFAIVNSFTDWSFGDVWSMYQEENEFTRPYLVIEYVMYYDKAGEATTYTQAKELLGVGVLDVALYNSVSFGDDYNALYNVATGVTHAGWATEFGGEKVYDFGYEHTATETLLLYPAYTIEAPEVETQGYSAMYDGGLHEISVIVTHELGSSAAYTYQWYKLNGDEYEEIAGATSATYSVMYVADSGTYKAAYSIAIGGYEYEYETEAVIVAITKADPVVPTDLTATYGQTLADIALPEGWVWADNTQSVGNVGMKAFSATYTPEDTVNCNIVTTDVVITVNKADPTYETPANLKATVGDTLAAVTLPDSWTWVDDSQELNKIGPCSYA